MNTNTVDIATFQQVAAQAGYNVSGTEISLHMTVAGLVVHILHQAVTGWGRIGGMQGLVTFFNTGTKPKPPVNPAK